MNDELTKEIVSAINGTASTTVKVQELVRRAVQEDPDTLVQVAIHIELKNKGREERNNKLSILRSQIRRACGALNMEEALTVRKVKGKWQVLTPQPRDPDVVFARKIEREAIDVAENLSIALKVDMLKDKLRELGWTPPGEEAVPSRTRRGSRRVQPTVQ